MCVIIVADQDPIPPEVIEAAYEMNDHGAGVAWREGGQMRWKKGLDLQESKDLISTLTIPYVAHFRIASCGGRVDELCHPFPVSDQVETLLDGTFDGKVMFHNGHYHRWQDAALEVAVKTNRPIPPGHWNDTRVMAWMAHIYGEGILDFTKECIAVFDQDDIRLYSDKWRRHTATNLLVSNDGWEWRWKGLVNKSKSFPFRDGRRVGKDGNLRDGASDDKEDHTSPETTTHPLGTQKAALQLISGGKDSSKNEECGSGPESGSKASHTGQQESQTEGANGGALDQIPFRCHEGSQEEGKDQQGTVEARQTGAPAGIDPGTHGASRDPMSPSERAKMFVWARSLNPKKLTGTGKPSSSSYIVKSGRCNKCLAPLKDHPQLTNVMVCTNHVCEMHFVKQDIEE